MLEIIFQQEFVLWQPLDRLKEEVFELEVATNLVLFKFGQKFAKTWVLVTALIDVIIEPGKLSDVSCVELEERTLFDNHIGNFL